MRKLFTLLTLAVAFLATAQHNVCVYRNDSVFHQIKLSDGELLRHTVNGDSITADFTDFISGDVSVPIAAIDSCVFRGSDIPVLRLAFPDFPEASALWEKELYVDAVLDIEGNGFCDDAEGLTLQVKGRGNSTWGMPKKPMRMKFPKKISLCGFKKMKNYVLLNNHIDPTLMRNVMAMWLARRVGIPYANTMVPCHVFINDHYAGAYTMTEKVGINSGSVDIDEEKGILFEVSIEYDEEFKFRSRHWDLPMMVKDPDFGELYEEDRKGMTALQRLCKWEEDWNNAEYAVGKGRADEVFDMQSVVNFIFVNEFVCNHELGFPKSLYIHKKSLDEGEKYYFGPVWDFDAAFNIAKYYPEENRIEHVAPDADIWLHDFLLRLRSHPEYQELHAKLVKEFEEEIFPEMMEYFEEYAALIEPSAKLNAMRWPGPEIVQDWTYRESSFDTDRHIGEMRDWLIARKNHICSAK